MVDGGDDIPGAGVTGGDGAGAGLVVESSSPFLFILSRYDPMPGMPASSVVPDRALEGLLRMPESVLFSWNRELEEGLFKKASGLSAMVESACRYSVELLPAAGSIATTGRGFWFGILEDERLSVPVVDVTSTICFIEARISLSVSSFSLPSRLMLSSRPYHASSKLECLDPNNHG